MKPIIRVENLSKQYRIGGVSEAYKTLGESISSTFRSPLEALRKAQGGTSQLIWALRDVSFELAPGDVLGLIGRNGAGKSTLLKILSRITEPTTGRVDIYGPIASLLEVGTGFHPELTGRENIFMNGAILGMKRAEIARKFDEIVAFSEIGNFLDTPVKRYSSGMHTRLAFSVAAHLDPEILVVDEVLAVGDSAFQRKCLGKMNDVATEGRTVIFVSHNMAAVQHLCRSAHLLVGGRIVGSGEPNDVIAQYLQLQTAGDQMALPLTEREDRKGDGSLRFVDFSISGVAASGGAVMGGSPTSFTVGYQARVPPKNVQISMAVYTPFGEGVLNLSNEMVGKPLDDLEPVGAIRISFAQLPLLPGTYHINLYCTVNGAIADWIQDAARIHVIEGDYYGTGRVPPKGYGHVVVPYEVDVVEEAGHLTGPRS